MANMLTAELLDRINFFYMMDYRTYQAGLKLYQENQTQVVEYHDDTGIVAVQDGRRLYNVLFQATGNRQAMAACECSMSGTGKTCAHIFAAHSALLKYIREVVQNSWQYRLNQAIVHSAKKPGSRQPYILFAALYRQDYYNSYQYGMRPFLIRVASLPELSELAGDASPEEINRLLVKIHGWQHAAQSPGQTLNPDGCINLPPEGVAAFNLILQSERYGGSGDVYADLLPLLARLKTPIFLHKGRSFGALLQVHSEPVDLEAALARDGQDYLLEAGLQLDERVYTAGKESLEIVTRDPAWVIAGNTLAPVKNPQALSLLETLPLHIPASQEQEFREQFLPQLVERVPVRGDVIQWEDVHGIPVPRLYLFDRDETLCAELRFGYEDYEVQPQLQPPDVSMLDLPGSWAMVRVHRSVTREQHFVQLLTEPVYRLKRAGKEHPFGTYELRARSHPFDFLLYSIPLLTQAGFEVFGEEKLKAGRVNRYKPTISLNITSGLDWFDLDAVVKYGDQSVALKDIRKALRKDERYVRLADGSIGQIPDEWMERYKRLFDLAEETANGLRVADYHLPLVDTLLEDAGQVQTPEEFARRRERLRNFENIQEQPIPAGFQGELRPYQKAGLDWLWFLREYGFGGCLADDMGLGKTIQVLALLELLRQRGQAKSASLLVAPKSLLANWQREAARFTPDLRFMLYVGNAREKDTSLFDQTDVVLTTYGVMLRDIELLRGYRFEYAILDESQAIKNPMAQSAKAARLLNAEHRLVMTGTPVENNTFELWSQFAFLNPGLLGGVEYFKREFAAPIESRQDEEAARLLRQLVYPFILRRTKDQVAPELPPRTERVLYTDLDTAQRKLYAQTRDRYRGILLGMIEQEGLDNTRMKILEGLLRLRQIAIHPALVEPTYHGEAPKFELLFETLETLQAEKHKALIFSQFIETLRFVRQALDAQKVPYAYLDGQTQDRQAQVDRFQEDPNVPFFLISLKAGGVGLNLTAADYVIHLDPWWNPAVEMQASDRAHRIGQDKPVFIYKLIARDTVEEKILQLQERKRNLVDQLITTESSFFKSLTKEDVKQLFS